ncbi:GTPase [uncultured Brachyspira sp.]|uniref:GTPase n=1 Tax=uncultured Brachyspira sp. TaxID=221953 RepID=UPI0025923ACA|nr:GTPase [uncultured Brachyspira sp.]
MNIDYSLLFLAYISIADECIYDKSLVFINEYIIQNNISEESKNEMHKILGDKEDKISLDSVLQNMASYDKEKINEILYMGLKIILFDGYLSKNEESIIHKFLSKNNITKEEYENIKNNVEKDIQKEENDLTKENELGAMDNIRKRVLSVLKNIPIKDIRDRLEKRYNSFLLNGPEYSEAINKTSNIAKVDLVEAKKVLTSSKNSLLKLDGELENLLNRLIRKITIQNSIINIAGFIPQNIKIYKKNNCDKEKLLKDESKEELENELNELLDDENKKEFENNLKELKNDISKIIHINIKELEEALEKKEKALKYYTISFIGKTKAGKSTLHSIITGTGDEFIGVGKQRTTRFNRIYEWKNIRIIDTPGIGAPGGKSDEEIAKSIIDESDLICYVLSDDGIYPKEFNFLKLIKDRNKPIVILLNIKEDIENEVLLKRYLKEPEKWYKRKDEKSLQGHINRIREYAKKHYSNEYFEIYPIQMLAAKMSNEEKYSDKKNILYKSSHIQDFLDNIRMQIIDEGIIKRSQTMVDGSIYIINYIHNALNSYINNLNAINNKFKINKEKAISNLKKFYEENMDILEKRMKTKLGNLKVKIAEFANENYDVKSKDELSSKLEKYLNDIGLNHEQINSEFKNFIERYKEALNESLKELAEDMELFSKIGKFDINFSSSIFFDIKKLIEIISQIIKLIGGILEKFGEKYKLVGIILKSIGTFFNFIASFFKSKEQRKTEAICKLDLELRKQVENLEKDINNILDKFRKTNNKINRKIENHINILCHYLENISKDLSDSNEELKKELDYLNSIYAYRILNYIKGDNIIEIDKKEINNIKVKRDYGKKIIIKSKYNINKNLEKKITKIIQEEVIFEKINNN